MVGCQNDDAPSMQPEEPQGYELVAIGEDGQNLYQFSINTAVGDTLTTNLSEELSIDGFFLTLRQVGDEVSFFSFSGGFFSWSKKDVVTGAVQILDDFYEDTPERSIVWGTNSENTIYLGHYRPSGTRNLALLGIPTGNTERFDLQLEFNIENLYQPVYFENRLFMTYRDGTQQYKVTVINTTDNTVQTTLDFGAEAPGLFITEDQNLGVIQFGESNSRTLTVYDLNSLAELDSYSTDINLPADSGESQNVHFDNGVLYFSATYPQPSPINFGPAVYDFATNDLLLPDLAMMVANYENESGKRITLTSQGFSNSQKLFFVGYAEADALGAQPGGFFVINAQGELVDRISTDFVPFYFLKD